MTLEAVIGKNGPNVAIEIDLRWFAGCLLTNSVPLQHKQHEEQAGNKSEASDPAMISPEKVCMHRRAHVTEW